MNAWDRFDRKLVLSFTGNADREKLLRRELDRVGMDGAETLWNTDTPYRRIVYEITRSIPHSMKFQFFNNRIQHYEAIKSSLELGCDHILLMEDDIRFLKDVPFVLRCVDELPSDYDIAHLDPVRFRKREGVFSTEHWKQWNSMRSAACYALSRNAMMRLVQIYEWMVSSEGARFYNSDTLFERSILSYPEPVPCVNLYGSVPNLARQVAVGHMPTNSNFEKWSEYYGENGAPRENYGD